MPPINPELILSLLPNWALNPIVKIWPMSPESTNWAPSGNARDKIPVPPTVSHCMEKFSISIPSLSEITLDLCFH